MSEVVLGDVIDEKDCCTIPVITLDDGFEAFLARSIPNLKLNIFVINLYCLESKIHADGGQVVF